MATSFTWFANGWVEERPPELLRDFNGDRMHWDVARDVWYVANVKKSLPSREQAGERDKAWTRAINARNQKRRRKAAAPANPASADIETLARQHGSCHVSTAYPCQHDPQGARG